MAAEPCEGCDRLVVEDEPTTWCDDCRKHYGVIGLHDGGPVGPVKSWHGQTGDGIDRSDNPEQ